MKTPIQPLVIDALGTLRFKENPIVTALLDAASLHGFDMNKIDMLNFSDEDRQQFAQLIGYSVSGYQTLSYVDEKAYERSKKKAAKFLMKKELEEDVYSDSARFF